MNDKDRKLSDFSIILTSTSGELLSTYVLPSLGVNHMMVDSPEGTSLSHFFYFWKSFYLSVSSLSIPILSLSTSWS